MCEKIICTERTQSQRISEDIKMSNWEAKSSSQRGTDASTCSQLFSIFVSDAVSVTRLHEVFCNSKTYTK